MDYEEEEENDEDEDTGGDAIRRWLRDDGSLVFPKTEIQPSPLTAASSLQSSSPSKTSNSNNSSSRGSTGTGGSTGNLSSTGTHGNDSSDNVTKAEKEKEKGKVASREKAMVRDKDKRKEKNKPFVEITESGKAAVKIAPMKILDLNKDSRELAKKRDYSDDSSGVDSTELCPADLVNKDYTTAESMSGSGGSGGSAFGSGSGSAKSSSGSGSNRDSVSGSGEGTNSGSSGGSSSGSGSGSGSGGSSSSGSSSSSSSSNSSNSSSSSSGDGSSGGGSSGNERDSSGNDSDHSESEGYGRSEGDSPSPQLDADGEMIHDLRGGKPSEGDTESFSSGSYGTNSDNSCAIVGGGLNITGRREDQERARLENGHAAAEAATTSAYYGTRNRGRERGIDFKQAVQVLDENSSASFDCFDYDRPSRRMSMVHRSALLLAVSGQPMDASEAMALEKVIAQNQKLMEIGKLAYQYSCLKFLISFSPPSLPLLTPSPLQRHPLCSFIICFIPLRHGPKATTEIFLESLQWL